MNYNLLRCNKKYPAGDNEKSDAWKAHEECSNCIYVSSCKVNHLIEVKIVPHAMPVYRKKELL